MSKDTVSQQKPEAGTPKEFSLQLVTDTYQLAVMTLQHIRDNKKPTTIDMIQLDAAEAILSRLENGDESGFMEFATKPEKGLLTITITSRNNKQYRFTLV